MYLSAFSRAGPRRPSRYARTCASEGNCSVSLNLGGNAVQTTPSRPLRSSQASQPSRFFLGGSPSFNPPINSGFDLGTPSRSRNFSRASSMSLQSINAQSDRTVVPPSAITKVMRPSLDWRANSTLMSGPSSNQVPRMGSSRASQTKDPHPRHAMFIKFAPYYILFLLVDYMIEAT